MRLGLLLAAGVELSLAQTDVAAAAPAAAALPNDVQDLCENSETADAALSMLADDLAESGEFPLEATVPLLLLRPLDLLRLRRSLERERSSLRASRRAPRVDLRTR